MLHTSPVFFLLAWHDTYASYHGVIYIYRGMCEQERDGPQRSSVVGDDNRFWSYEIGRPFDERMDEVNHTRSTSDICPPDRANTRIVERDYP